VGELEASIDRAGSDGISASPAGRPRRPVQALTTDEHANLTIGERICELPWAQETQTVWRRREGARVFEGSGLGDGSDAARCRVEGRLGIGCAQRPILPRDASCGHRRAHGPFCMWHALARRVSADESLIGPPSRDGEMLCASALPLPCLSKGCRLFCSGRISPASLV
jgi:hypothetical protein